MKKQIEEDTFNKKPIGFGWKNSGTTNWSSRTSIVKLNRNKNYINKMSQALTSHLDESDIANIDYQIPDIRNQHKLKQNICNRYSKQKNHHILKQKNNSKQIAWQFSSFIDKSLQNNHLQQNQLERIKIILHNQRKQKCKLLAEQNDWKVERSKLLQQKQIILFALQSLTLKNNIKYPYKKGKSTHGHASYWVKPQVQSNNKFQIPKKSFKVNYQSNQITTLQTPKPQKMLTQSSANEMLDNLHQQITITRQPKQHLNIISNNFQYHNETKQQLQLTQQKLNKSILQIQSLSNSINNLNQSKSRDTEIIAQLNKQIATLKNQNNESITNYKHEVQKNDVLLTKIRYLQTQKQTLQLNLIQHEDKNKQLEKQLQITKQQYSTKQQKQKQYSKILSHFTKQLKASDLKIQQFFNSQQLSQHKCNIVYQQHLSYLLHLCKKKQSLYQNLLQSFQNQSKQNDFRYILLLKKVNRYDQYQQQLKSLVDQENCQLDDIKHTILQFKF